jgi:hypothetical protein
MLYRSVKEKLEVARYTRIGHNGIGLNVRSPRWKIAESYEGTGRPDRVNDL